VVASGTRVEQLQNPVALIFAEAMHDQKRTPRLSHQTRFAPKRKDFAIVVVWQKELHFGF
jgi:hypothetical protein